MLGFEHYRINRRNSLILTCLAFAELDGKNCQFSLSCSCRFGLEHGQLEQRLCFLA